MGSTKMVLYWRGTEVNFYLFLRRRLAHFIEPSEVLVTNSSSHGRYMIHVRRRNLLKNEILDASTINKREYTIVVIVSARDKTVNVQPEDLIKKTNSRHPFPQTQNMYVGPKSFQDHNAVQDT